MLYIRKEWFLGLCSPFSFSIPLKSDKMIAEVGGENKNLLCNLFIL